MSSRIVIVVAVLGYLTAVDAACSFQQINCYRPFFAGYNITLNSMDWPSYWVPFHETRSAMLTNQGISVQPYVCQLGNALVNCTMQLQSACMDATTYTMLGANATDSADYWTDLAVTAYQCGAGYDVLMRDFYCMGACRASSAAKLDKCTADLGMTIAGGGDRCKAYNTFVTCESVIYAGCCGQDAGSFMCGVNQAGINSGDPSCSMSGQLYKCPKMSRTIERHPFIAQENFLRH